jgi:hypothetical protein
MLILFTLSGFVAAVQFACYFSLSGLIGIFNEQPVR